MDPIVHTASFPMSGSTVVTPPHPVREVARGEPAHVVEATESSSFASSSTTSWMGQAGTTIETESKEIKTAPIEEPSTSPSVLKYKEEKEGDKSAIHTPLARIPPLLMFHLYWHCQAAVIYVSYDAMHLTPHRVQDIDGESTVDSLPTLLILMCVLMSCGKCARHSLLLLAKNPIPKPPPPTSTGWATWVDWRRNLWKWHVFFHNRVRMQVAEEQRLLNQTLHRHPILPLEYATALWREALSRGETPRDTRHDSVLKSLIGDSFALDHLPFSMPRSRPGQLVSDPCFSLASSSSPSSSSSTTATSSTSTTATSSSTTTTTTASSSSSSSSTTASSSTVSPTSLASLSSTSPHMSSTSGVRFTDRHPRHEHVHDIRRRSEDPRVAILARGRGKEQALFGSSSFTSIQRRSMGLAGSGSDTTIPLADQFSTWNGDVIIHDSYVHDLPISMYSGHDRTRVHAKSLQRLWWAFIHLNALGWNMEAWAAEPKRYMSCKLMLELWVLLFPDRELRARFLESITKTRFPSYESCIKDPRQPWLWSVSFHNHFRKACGKAEMAEPEALDLWVRTATVEGHYLPRQ